MTPSPAGQVCKRAISIAPVYAADAPARLPLPEFMIGLANKLMAWLLLLLSLLFAICVWELLMPLTTLWVWRLALSRTWAQVRRLLYLRTSTTRPFLIRFMPSADTVLACVSIRRAFLRELHNIRQLNAPARLAADAIAPLALWVARAEANLQQRFGGLDTLQVLALHTVEASLMVVIGDVAFALLLGFLPFSLGRLLLCCASCLSFGTLDTAPFSASTPSVLLLGYGFILMMALLFTGLHTFHQYSRGERLTIAVYFHALTDLVYWLLTPLSLLPSVHVMLHGTFTFLYRFFWGIISLVNVCLNLTAKLVLRPLFLGCLLDIYTSKLFVFGVEMPQKLHLLFAPSFASTALHWLIGCISLMLHSLLSSFIRSVFRLGVSATGGQIKIGEPFCKFYLKILPGLFLSVIYAAMVILVPVEVAFRLAPTLFPLNITYFDPPTQGTELWQATRNFQELLCAVFLLKFLIFSAIKYLEPGVLVQKVLRRYVAVRVMLLMVLAWLTVVIFNAALLVAPISVGRALLFAIPQLPVTGTLKSNDLFAFAIGFCILSTIVAASRDAFAYMTSGRTRLLVSVIGNWGITALKSCPLLFLWAVVIPFMIGLLADCLLISPLANEVPILDFSTWFLGLQLLEIWKKMVGWTRVVPFLGYFIDERWDRRLTQAREDGFSGVRPLWVLREILMPITVKLLYALCVPYVLAKGVAPRLGYSASVNSAVLRFAWLGSLALCLLFRLGKALARLVVRLHDSIRDERYLIGRRVHNYYADNNNM
ncbi:hypothetical protein U9M48_041349 [Paspalum notatum var. saurae]|uniref:E3 ubiquitin-protein ligase MARCHF6-like C-terminal domain-containing protein n=1 Tax=Paspalum notatum var. saurae TaxID=547442 RepID=A0AAQ3USY7_PASNO